MKLDMFNYYKMVKENDINLIYSGPIWADGVEGIGGTLRKRLEFDELPLSASQSVFSVFVEQMNNMLMYSAEKEEFPSASEDKHINASSGVFVLGSVNKTYYLQSGNLMKPEMVDLMKDRIDFLNSLDKEGLRKYYKQQLRGENTNPESKGAGIGLTEIAKRASSKIEYKFEPADGGLTFFSMYVVIGEGGK